MFKTHSSGVVFPIFFLQIHIYFDLYVYAATFHSVVFIINNLKHVLGAGLLKFNLDQ